MIHPFTFPLDTKVTYIPLIPLNNQMTVRQTKKPLDELLSSDSVIVLGQFEE